MTIFDVVILIILTGFIVSGFIKGLIRSVGSLVAVIAGVWAALYFSPVLYEWLSKLFFGNINMGKIVCFMIVYIIVNRLINFGFSVLNTTYNFISFIPFLRTINRVGGALFAFVEGGLVLGLLLYAAMNFPFLKDVLTGWAKHSQVAPFLISYSKFFLPILPSILKESQQLLQSFNLDVIKNWKF